MLRLQKKLQKLLSLLKNDDCTVAAITAACVSVADAIISMYHEVGTMRLTENTIDNEYASRRSFYFDET